MYLTHAINQSPTIYGEANAALTAPAMKAVALNASGKVILPAASGDLAIGVVLADAADIPAGGRVNIQIKDICFALAGETIKRGDVLMAHTDGTVKKAPAGKQTIGIALADAMMGEISPAMANAVASSSAYRVLIPMNLCDTYVAGTVKGSSAILADAMEHIRQLTERKTDE